MPEQIAPSTSELEEKAYLLERRAWLRHPAEFEATGKSLPAESGLVWSGKVLNLSKGGLGLVLDRRFEPGTLLRVSIDDPTETSSRSVMIRVVHDTLITAYPGLRWLIGCAFIHRLSDEELQAFLS